MRLVRDAATVFFRCWLFYLTFGVIFNRITARLERIGILCSTTVESPRWSTFLSQSGCSILAIIGTDGLSKTRDVFRLHSQMPLKQKESKNILFTRESLLFVPCSPFNGSDLEIPAAMQWGGMVQICWFEKKKKKRNYVRYKLVFHSNLTRVALIIMFYSQRAEGQEGFKIPTVINVFRSTKSSVCAVCTAGSSKNISCITRTIGTKLVLI